MKQLLDEIEKMPISERQKLIQNKVMDTHYNVMFLALVEELGEYVASLGYPDWKVVARNELNMQVELADICIFAMNCEFYDSGRIKISDVEYNISYTGFSPDVAFVDEILRMVVEKDFSSIPSFIISNRPNVMYAIEAKQALNVIRQAFGYKEGKYNKIWGDYEDNMYMMSLINSRDPDIVNKMIAKAREYQRN